MKIKAAKEFVVLTNPKEIKTETGLTLVQEDEKGKKPELGVVYDIGEGELPLDIKVGDTIVFRRYTDNRIFVEGKEYNFIEFKDIAGVCLT